MSVTRDIHLEVSDNEIFLIDLTSTASIQYYGYAAPGTAQSDPNWKLYLLDLDVNGVPIGKRFAGGSPAYINTWANRTSLVYS